MNAPLDHAVLNTSSTFREFIAERLAAVQLYADMGKIYAAAGDDAGLTYSISCATAHLRQAISTLLDLKASRGRS